MKNSGYFLREVRLILRTSLLASISSLVSISLIFLLLAMVISGWWVSTHVLEIIQGEAEIYAYYHESASADILVEEIKKIDGVRDAKPVSEHEAFKRMEEVLGKEARVLQYLDENPFSAFIEINIHLERIESVVTQLSEQPAIEYVRDNRNVLEQLRNLAAIIRYLGFLMITAAGISTLVIISHIIRQGIDNNREQINTLVLLGAPDQFINLPFLLAGLLLTLGGGILAALFAAVTLNFLYARITGPLPFIPLPPLASLLTSLILLIFLVSVFLGTAGSLAGLHAAKNRK